MFDFVAFDADDTLWHNESLYRMGRERTHELLEKYPISGSIDESLNEIEIGNLPFYGYGVMGFVLSLIEASIRLTNGRISSGDIQSLIELGKEMLGAEVQLFEGAEEVVAELSRAFPLMLITKGDLNHQRSKIDRSGIGNYFQHIEIVNEKSASIYAEILTRHGIDAGRFLMIGNSLRSDILPVIELGGQAIHIPNHLTWSYEAIEPSSSLGYLEVEGLRQVPELVRRLARNPAV